MLRWGVTVNYWWPDLVQFSGVPSVFTFMRIIRGSKESVLQVSSPKVSNFSF